MFVCVCMCVHVSFVFAKNLLCHMFEIALNPCAIDPSDTAFTSTQFVPRQIGFSAVINDLVVNIMHVCVCMPVCYLLGIATLNMNNINEIRMIMRVDHYLHPFQCYRSFGC